MSNYLGFNPLESSDYFFLSYNNEDAERLTPLARELHSRGIPLWYDHGIDYGQKWEKIISEKIEKSKAVLLLFTKDILKKEDSYVKKEYRMATEYFNKAVFVAVIDRIEKDSIPSWNVPWWMDVEARQYINLSDAKDVRVMADKICGALGKKDNTAYPDTSASDALLKRKAETPVIKIDNGKQSGVTKLCEEKESDEVSHDWFESGYRKLADSAVAEYNSRREIDKYFNENHAGNTIGRKLFTEAEKQYDNENYKKAFDLYCKCSTYMPREFSYLCHRKAECCRYLCGESYNALVDLIGKGGIKRTRGYSLYAENRNTPEGQEFLKWEQEGKKWNEKAMSLTPGLDARTSLLLGGKDYFGCDYLHYLWF